MSVNKRSKQPVRPAKRGLAKVGVKNTNSKPIVWRNQKRKNDNFAQLLDQSCGTSSTVLDTEVDWFSLTYAADVLFLDMLKKNTWQESYSQGQWLKYLKVCFGYYLKKNQRWLNSDDNFISAGAFFIPAGYALLFKQNSEFRRKNNGFIMQVSSDDAPATLTATVPNYLGGRRPVWTGSDYDAVLDGTNTAAISPRDYLTMSTFVKQTYPDAVQVSSIIWGAKSGELFVGAQGTSLTKIYPWSQLVSWSAPYLDEMIGFRMDQTTNTDIVYVILDILLNSLNGAKSVAQALKLNGYDPMLFDVRWTFPDGSYFANIITAMARQIGITDEDYFMFNIFCWSYIASFLPLINLKIDLRSYSNPAFRSFKVPWPLFNCALQSSCRVGSTYYYLNTSISNTWQSVYAGADTTVAYPSAHIFGHPGYLSSNVAGAVIASPGVLLTGAPTTHAWFSWTNAEKAYTYLIKAYPNLMVMAEKMPGDMVDCACFSTIGVTDFSDDIVNQNLGLLSPKTIVLLECSSALPAGLCGIAGTFTYRTALDTANVYTNSNSFKLTQHSQNLINSVMSLCFSETGTTVQALQASKKTISSYIYEQVSSGYEWMQPSEDQIVEMLKEWVVGSPTVKKVSDATVKQLTSSLPKWVSSDALVSHVSSLGWSAIKPMASVLVGKFIGLANTNHRRNEL
jgi:hypothetical protein